MTSAVAILTFRRRRAIECFLKSILANGLHLKYKVAVFEDCGNWDDTVQYLTEGYTLKERDHELDADRYVVPLAGGEIEVFVSRTRSGVACGSNKAIRWFERLDYDHLLLCNDDLECSGDFVAEYQEAITKLGFEYLTFNDFEDEIHKPTLVRYKMHDVRIMIRMVGIMVSMTKRVVKSLGYYDERFPFFGEEHCEYNNRARLRGFVNLNSQAQLGLDIVSKHLKHQDLESSIFPFEKPVLDRLATQVINQAAFEYFNRDIYRPYRLRHAQVAEGFQDAGIPSAALDILGYKLVYEHAEEEDSW
jgi:GT2 family glycosyltransferase